MNENKSYTADYKKSILEWLGIGVIIGFLYLSGLHTDVLATMQRECYGPGFLMQK